MAMIPENIRDLIKEDTNDGIQKLDNGTLKGFVKNLATFMAKENKSLNEGFLGHLPIHESDYPGEDGFSLYEFFDNRIDLDGVNEEINDSDEVKNRDNFIQYIIDSLQNQSEQVLWNKSMDDILKDYINYCNKDFEIKGSTQLGHEYTVEDIQRANAGRNFYTSEDDQNKTEWVRPLADNTGDEYATIRGDDKINKVLNSKKNLQFTRKDKINGTTLDYYIRLIMPKYTRRVEVEDLNRNFWVIGQALSAVAAALFDNDGPIKKFMRYSLSEILQLWENVIYLWAAVRLLNEKQGEAPEPEPIPYNSSNTVFQVIDLPRAQDKPYRDINEFVNDYETWYNTETNSGGVRGKLRQFEKIYPNKHLAFLLRCRIGNYEKDYYHTEIYPYVVFFDANAHQGANSWHCVKLCNYQNNVEHEYEQPHKKWPFGITLRIDSGTDDGTADHYFPNSLYRVQNLRGRVYGVREEGILNPNKYYFYWPFSDLTPHDNYKQPNGNTKSTKTGDPGGNNIYRAIVRIKPTISSGYSDTASENTQIKVKINFEIEDVARKLHWLTQASEGAGETASAQYDRYKDYKGKDGVSHNPEWNIKKTTEKIIEDNGTINREITIDIDGDWGEWGHEYNSASNPHGVAIYNDSTQTNPGFTDNFRDSGFQGSLCDMITYRGITKS